MLEILRWDPDHSLCSDEMLNVLALDGLTPSHDSLARTFKALAKDGLVHRFKRVKGYGHMPLQSVIAWQVKPVDLTDNSAVR